MTTVYTCGHEALLDDAGDFLNGSHCLWQEYTREFDVAECYGSLCNECIAVRGATKCNLGGFK